MADKPQFQIQMKGYDVAPDTVRAADLALFLEHIDGAITETAKDLDVDLAYDADAAIVCLVGIKHGQSSDLTLAVEAPLSEAVRRITEAISTRRFTSLPPPAQAHLHEISKHAIRKQWAYELTSVNGLRLAHAVISEESPVPPPPLVATAKGRTVIWGHLIRIGGREPKAVIRQRNGKLLSVEITQRLARELGPLVYRDIGIQGVAEWRLRDWAVLRLVADGVLEYQPDSTSLARTFQKMSEGSKGRWDDVDAAQYVDDLRGEDSK